MDRLLKSNWIIKITSFLSALMLYTIVGMSDNQAPNPTSVLPKVTEGSETIEDVPLVAYYDDAKYVLSGLPETVIVELEGSNDKIIMEKFSKTNEVYVDLQGLTPGKHIIRVDHQGFPEDLKVKIKPSTVTVVIEEKKMKDFPIKIDFINEDQIAEGYTLQEPIVTPNTVTVIGTEEQLNKVTFIKGFIDVKDAKDTITKSVPINLYDHDGNEINDLEFDPSVIDVKVPIIGPYKTVPIKINRTGKLEEGLSIKSLEIEPAAVTLFGSKETLEKVEFIEGPAINLNEIKKDTTLELELPTFKGVNKMEPTKVKVRIEIGQEETKSFQSIPIKVTGLLDGLEASFLDPQIGEIDVTFKGAASILEKLKKSDIEAYIDVSGLSEGEHSVKVELNGPQHITWDETKMKVKIAIQTKHSADIEPS